ncbi:glycosyltransferase [Flavobacterium sp. CF136]|uniref:glycosyltransferase n=1 Tax=Flavobacterium sp. (strain CF136) TaxID=1144313 RepID=UPI0002715223|nr:glycosyltransferase [Flavobacterium sp. CF136]EJL66734.1 glycosyl transferase [Flavobacterium sp. CF136]
MKEVLVILAAYNGGKYISEQLSSILEQKDVNVHIKVYDDVSSDNTVEVVKTFVEDDRIELIQNIVGHGSAASNFFNAISTLSENTIKEYNYVSFSDQDDLWLPNKLNAAVNVLLQENSSLYCSNLLLWNERTDKTSIIKKSYSQTNYDYLFEGGSAGCTYVFTSEFCLKLKKIIGATDYFDWQYFSHDWFVYFYARISKCKVSIDKNIYIKYRIHSNNVHGQLNQKSLFAISERLKLIKKGWYFKQIREFVKLTDVGSPEKKIYELYYRNYFTRLYILLRYNFSLIRSNKKFIQFFITSLLPIRINK